MRSTARFALALAAAIFAATPLCAVQAPGSSAPHSSASASQPLPLALPAPRTTPLATTTTLGISPASPIAWPAAVTLTATVKDANLNPVARGTVLFCTSLALCRANVGHGDEGILGTAQITGPGTATLHLILAPGSYSSLVAIFLGTATDLASTSATLTQPLVITGQTPTAASLSATGNPGNYTLSSALTAGGILPPAGSLLFLDTTYSNTQIASASLPASIAVPQFLLASSPTVNTGPHSIAIADFNGDSIPDLAVASYGDLTQGNGTTISIFLGTGSGQFAAPSVITVGNGPSAIVSADFNNDGFADLAVTNYNSQTITILLGDGHGNFATHSTSTATGSGPWSILAVDMNNDGNLDLVVCNSDDNVSSSDLNGSVSIYLGDGAGNFSLIDKPTVGETPVEAAAGDFNDDGNADLAVANQNSNTITVLFGNGAGGFSSTATLNSQTEPVTVTVGDFNLDGHPDLAAGDFSTDSAAVWLGDGAGNFTPAAHSPFAAGSGPQTIRTGDFNNDGLPDLVASDGTGNNFTILLGDGSGGFTPLNSPAPTGIEPFYFAAADLNGDGMTDLVSANLGGGSLSVLLGQWSSTVTLSNIAVSQPGTHQVDASFPGDTTHVASMSGTVPLLGSQSATTTSILGMPASLYAGNPLQLTAQVMPNTYYTFTAGRTITFYDYSAPIASMNISAAGTATLNIPAVTQGVHYYSAQYSGDVNFLPSTSPTLSYIALPASIAVSAAPTTFTVQQGNATAASTLKITTVDYNGTYTFSCTNVPLNALCEFTPASLTIAADGTQAINFSLQTSGYFWTYPYKNAGFITLPAIALAAVITLRRRKVRSSLPTLVALLLLMAIASTTLGCGNGPATFTPVGNYTVDVTVTGPNFSQTFPYAITVVPLQ